MPHFADRVRVATATTGTGTVTLGAAMPGGFRTFSGAAIPDTSIVRYVIEDGNNAEVGLGTYASGAGTLTRSITGPGGWSTTGSLLSLSGNAVVSITFATIDWRNACMVAKTTNQTGLSGSLVVIDWDSEIYDDGGWHDNATNNSRLTVPAGVDRIRAGAFMSLANIDDGVQVFINLSKNGASTWTEKVAQVAPKLSTSAQQPRVSLSSGQCNAVSGDYFEIWTSTTPSDTSYDVVASVSNFWIEAC